jgi:hypothetical protein
MIQDGAYLTQAGEALIAKILARQGELVFTRCTVGNGEPPETATAYEAMSEYGYIRDAEIENVSNPVNGTAQVGVQISSIGVSDGFFITNLGLYAQDPEGEEILFNYFAQHEHPQWIRPEGENVNSLARYELAAIVSGVKLISAVINPSVFITYDQMEEYHVKVIVPEYHDYVTVKIDEHNHDKDAHDGRITQSENRLTEVEKAFAGQGSTSFLFDFTSELGVPDIRWNLVKGVWNRAENRVEW